MIQLKGREIMVLSSPVVTLIKNTIMAASYVGIEEVIIEQGIARGMRPDRIIILSQRNDIELPFTSLTMGRLETFKNRLAMVESQPGFTLDVTLDEANEEVLSVSLKATGINIDYRCMQLKMVHNDKDKKVPKELGDIMNYRIKLTNSTIQLLSKAQTAMSADSLTLLKDDKGVAFQFIEASTRDKFVHVLTTDTEKLNDSAKNSFAVRYPARLLLSLFKLDGEASFTVGEKGVLKINVNGFTAFVVPQV